MQPCPKSPHIHSGGHDHVQRGHDAGFLFALLSIIHVPQIVANCLGMSDIGRSLECPRATLANKLFARNDQSIEDLLPLKNSRSALDAQIREIEQGLKDAYNLSDADGNGINTGSHRFKVSQHPGRRTLNRDRLPSGADGFSGR